MSRESSRRELLRIINEQLIPLTQRESPAVLLMEPEYLRRAHRDISYHSGQPLLLGNKLARSPILLKHWPDQQVHASRFPCLQAVVEGEIDWRVGIVQKQEQPLDKELQQADVITVPMSEGTFFFTPAGVPYSDGQGVHWERPLPRKGRATVFWMIIMPSGVMCHFCRSTATDHRSHFNVFVRSSFIFQLARMLEDELSTNGAESGMLVRAYLQGILVHTQRGLKQRVQVVPIETDDSQQEWTSMQSNVMQDTLQRARLFIESHLQESLNPATVAAHAYLSISQLERYFQRELGMSITDYITRRRMEVAKGLLQHTDLLIRQVGEMVGYRNQSSFTQIFKRYTGTSPRECRQSRA